MPSFIARAAVVTAAFISLLAVPNGVAAQCWLPPVAGTVTDPFREPPCRWCAGNRGIEYRVAAQTVVRAVAAGHVVYSGTVAGVGYVVVRHADGRRVTYGRLVERLVTRGDVVVARARIGRASGTFHFGLRDGDRYLDPAPLLGRLVGPTRLVPVDGSRPRPPGPPQVACGSRFNAR